jgi:NADP-dependent 3-hydroxy acid dehydrogenase YdfG
MIQADLSDKVTIITGASSGMGAAMARRFAACGSRVVLAARRVDRLEALADEIAQAGGTALAVPCDVKDWQQVQSLANRAVEHFGQIDVMVNNAGFGYLRTFAKTPIERIEAQIDVNFKGVCYGCKAVLPHMIERRSGHIINIGSVGSARHYAMFAVYVGAKHAVLGFSRSLYEEVREFGIRVNVLCPGATNTEFMQVAGFREVPWPTDGMIQATDIAELALACVAMPPHVQIDTAILWPVCQAT